jgi:SAM-dependent methyltransferase
MQEEAYLKITELQATHWWFVGARHIYRALLETGRGKAANTIRLIDIGCGTGGNLELLSEYGPVAAMDISLQALLEIKIRPVLGLVQASSDALPFAENSFDVANLLGVIEHLDDDLAALREAGRVCSQGGFITLLTSAFPILWSHHDVANRHRRRYRLGQLEDRLRKAGLAPRILTYQNFFVFPPTLIVRLLQQLHPKPPGIDVGRPPKLLNSVLIGLARLEAFLIRKVRLPFGVDLVALCHVDKTISH